MHWAIKQAPDLIIWKSASSTPPPPYLTVKIVNGEDEAQAWNPSTQHASQEFSGIQIRLGMVSNNK